MHPRTPLLCAGLALALAGSARADVRVHPLFTDRMVLQRDVPLPVWGTARPGEAVTVTVHGDKVQAASERVVADANGQWRTGLPKLAAGGPLTLTVAGPNNRVELQDVLVGEVWVCSGQSNMEFVLHRSFEPLDAIAKAANPAIRLLTVSRHTAAEPQADFQGAWQRCDPDTAKNFSAVGYFFGRDLQKALNVPVGLIHASWGGTPAQAWTSRAKLASVDALRHYTDEYDQGVQDYDPAKAKTTYDAALAKYRTKTVQGKAPQLRPPPWKNPSVAATLYNGMIAPLVPFPIAGATWYQGEANNGRAFEYRTLLPALIDDWRAKWGCGDFPFLVVQLAPYWNKDAQGQTYAELREAQLLTAQKLSKVGLAVITDVGDEQDIHPTKKEPVGQRLALLARKIAYGEDLVANGPVYKSLAIEGSRAVVGFDSVGAGLECQDDKLIGFEVCGDDRKFCPADAAIEGDTVVVTCGEVEKPVAVRYGFRNYVAGLNLWNKDGLPATPFRTDSFPGATEKK